MDNFLGEGCTAWLYNNATSLWNRVTSFGATYDNEKLRHISEIGFESVVHNIATSMTELGRDSSNDTVAGTVYINQTFVSIVWPWITLPILILVLTALFLGLTIFTSHKKSSPLWKTSVLPFLYHSSYQDFEGAGYSDSIDGLQNGDVGEIRGEYLTLSRMENAVSSTTVQLDNSRSTRWLMT